MTGPSEDALERRVSMLLNAIPIDLRHRISTDCVAWSFLMNVTYATSPDDVSIPPRRTAPTALTASISITDPSSFGRGGSEARPACPNKAAPLLRRRRFDAHGGYP